MIASSDSTYPIHCKHWRQFKHMLHIAHYLYSYSMIKMYIILWHPEQAVSPINRCSIWAQWGNQSKFHKLEPLMGVHDWIAGSTEVAPFLHGWKVFPVCKNRDWGAPGQPRRFQWCMANVACCKGHTRISTGRYAYKSICFVQNYDWPNVCNGWVITMIPSVIHMILVWIHRHFRYIIAGWKTFESWINLSAN